MGLLFPGQGSQFVGMGRDLAETFPEAAEIFDEADDTLGLPISKLCWDGPEDELTLTMNAQPAILIHSVAVWRVIARIGLAPTVAAGHSLGEFSAYVAAGTFTFPDALRAVRRRGELMYESGTERPGTMAAVLGLDDAVVEAACAQASVECSGTVVAANFNAPGQVVISGDTKSVEVADRLLRAAGAKRVIPLNVSGAFHSPLMRVAEEGLLDQLEATEFRDPGFPVVSNVTASPVHDGSTARSLLIEQLTSPVRWVASMQAMLAAGVTSFIEIGPGNVLSGLLRRVDRNASGKAVGTVAEVNALLRGEG